MSTHFWHTQWDPKKSTMMKNSKNNEVDQGNIQTVTKDQVKDADKAKFEAHMNDM
jgi:hypothetical protein